MTHHAERQLYEILFRFDGDTLKGVHQVDIEHIVETATGERVHHRVLDPQPITAEVACALLNAETLRLANAIIERDARIAELERGGGG